MHPCWQCLGFWPVKLRLDIVGSSDLDNLYESYLYTYFIGKCNNILYTYLKSKKVFIKYI